MRVLVIEERCCGAGNCVLASPAVFDQREEDGLVVVLKDAISPEEEADVKRAAHLCPAAAIRLCE